MSAFKKIASYIWDIPIEKSGSELNPYLEVVWSQGRKMLNSQNANYSFGNGYKVFEKAFETLQTELPQCESVLVLGFGCGSVEHLLQKVYGLNPSITGVEYDAEIIRLYNEHFRRNDDTQLVLSEAMAFLTQNKKKYDLIIIDLFEDLSTVPLIFETLFTKALLARCSTKGTLVYNTVKSNENAEQRTDLLIALHEQFKTVQSISFQDINEIIIAK